MSMFKQFMFFSQNLGNPLFIFMLYTTFLISENSVQIIYYLILVGYTYSVYFISLK